jgi:uncharacterized membrane protein (UPF0127 family)
MTQNQKQKLASKSNKMTHKDKRILGWFLIVLFAIFLFSLLFLYANDFVNVNGFNSEKSQSYQVGSSVQNPTSKSISNQGVNQYNLIGFVKKSDVEYQLIQLDVLEIADTPNERAGGYMNRADICDKCGMLFVFDDEQPRNFWMQNTPTSLDIIYFDTNGKAVEIAPNTKPNQILEQYPSVKSARFVLEVKAGQGAKLGIEKGKNYDLAEISKNAIPYNWSYTKEQ